MTSFLLDLGVAVLTRDALASLTLISSPELSHFHHPPQYLQVMLTLERILHWGTFDQIAARIPLPD